MNNLTKLRKEAYENFRELRHMPNINTLQIIKYIEELENRLFGVKTKWLKKSFEFIIDDLHEHLLLRLNMMDNIKCCGKAIDINMINIPYIDILEKDEDGRVGILIWVKDVLNCQCVKKEIYNLAVKYLCYELLMGEEDLLKKYVIKVILEENDSAQYPHDKNSNLNKI